MSSRPPKSEYVKKREADHKARLAEHREHVAERRINWPKETRGPCSRCGLELTNGTINHLSFGALRLGDRSAAIQWTNYHTDVQLCPACVKTVEAFARAPVGAWQP